MLVAAAAPKEVLGKAAAPKAETAGARPKLNDFAVDTDAEGAATAVVPAAARIGPPRKLRRRL